MQEDPPRRWSTQAGALYCLVPALHQEAPDTFNDARTETKYHTGLAMKAERDEILERVLQQRGRHRERSLAVRVAVALAGALLSIFAAILSVVLPEVGLPLLLVGLRLLAFEFDWAARYYARVYRLAGKLRKKAGDLSPHTKSALLAIGALAVTALAIWLTRTFGA